MQTGAGLRIVPGVTRDLAPLGANHRGSGARPGDRRGNAFGAPPSPTLLRGLPGPTGARVPCEAHEGGEGRIAATPGDTR